MMINNLKVAVLQLDLIWEDNSANLNHIDSLLAGIKDVDLIILPEMFNTGFSMESNRLSEKMNGETVSWMVAKAKEIQAVITGSIIIEENQKYYNRLVWVGPDEELHYYDKRHLFRMAKEDQHFDAGKERKIMMVNGWRVCPLICYDLRFPVWSRNIDENGSSVYDCLIYVANWPAVRSLAWSSLLVARALENQCYLIGVNRVGEDGNGIKYNGSSAIISPKGERLDEIPVNKEHLEKLELDFDSLVDFRNKFPVGMDSDRFNLIE